MDTAPSTPDPDVIYALYKGDYKTQLVRLALRLVVFAHLTAGPADDETVARECSCAVKGMHALLEYLQCIHLLIAESEPPSEEVSLLNVALTAINGGAVYTVAD